MKFLLFQISIISSDLSILDNNTPLNTSNTTLSLGVEDSVTHTSDNVLSNYSEYENFLRENISSKRQLNKRNADEIIKLPDNLCLDYGLIKNIVDDILKKVFAINKIKSSIDKTNNSEKFYFDKYFKKFQDYIKHGKIKRSNDPLSIFFETLGRETYDLIYFVTILGKKVKEEDRNQLNKKLVNILDVKFKNEKSLEVLQFFDKKKLIKFLDTLAVIDAKIEGKCRIAIPLFQYRLEIMFRDVIKKSTSTGNSISNKQVFKTSSTKTINESVPSKENTSKNDHWDFWFLLLFGIFISVLLILYLSYILNKIRCGDIKSRQ